ncbi:MAG TPA: hypothetical protein VJ672_05955 [Gemmatimonadaceae bacterium]|nr:hypothetical protein [Gemmatimonadaceae bacterium]
MSAVALPHSAAPVVYHGRSHRAAVGLTREESGQRTNEVACYAGIQQL